MRAWIAMLLVGALLAGCSSTKAPDSDLDGIADDVETSRGLDPQQADTDGDGIDDGAEDEKGLDPKEADTDGDGTSDGDEVEKGSDPRTAEAMRFLLSDVGQQGAEPSVGVTSTGCIFFVAFEKVMRSCDLAATWEHLSNPLLPPTSSDPYLWVDPVTDRIFDVQMLDTVCTQIAWSDDDGASWTLNPADCGPVPQNDHIKLATGPWTPQGYGMAAALTTDVYPQAVYFCHNIPGVYCYTSFDGGMTFPVGATGIGDTGSAGGLHGAITTAPDGTVYVPPRLEVPTVLVSKDNGFSFTSVAMGQDVGTPNPRKNSEIATDTASNAYHVWIGEDAKVYMARSTDSGVTWDKTSLLVSPADVVSTTFPHVQAGDPGRVAVAYLGSTDEGLLGTADIDDDEWNGNPHYAPEGVTYDLYVTYSLDALSDAPTWSTVRLTSDPVQRGSICISSGDCRNIGGSNRNLLDFNDLTLGPDGRLYIAYADGCTGTCASDDESGPEDSRSRQGFVAVQTEGPWLLAGKVPAATPPDAS